MLWRTLRPARLPLVAAACLTFGNFGNSVQAGARVAHHGFPNPAVVSNVLTLAGHTAYSLTTAQVESGQLLAGGYDVFVLGRNSTLTGATAQYVQGVGAYVAAGGNIVTEFAGFSMFMSSYGQVKPISMVFTPQLGLFTGKVQGSGSAQYKTGTPISLVNPAHAVAAGLPNPMSEGEGTEFFFWIETSDPDLEVVGDFLGNGFPGFPLGQRLPCMVVGCVESSTMVFGTWDWYDTLSLNGHNRKFFLNAVAFAALGCGSPPEVLLPSSYTVECQGSASSLALDASGCSDADGDSLTYAWSTDCPGGSFSDPQSPTPVLTFDATAACAGTSNVSLTVSDGTYQSSASATVSFQDSTPPVIALNGGGTMVLQCHEEFVDPGAVATDACGGSMPVVVAGDVVTCDLGTYLVSYDAVDSCGNVAAQVVRTVVVMDPIPPMFVSLPNNLTAECEGPDGAPAFSSAIEAFLNTAVASDSCDPAVSVSHNAPSLFPSGVTIVTWTARDHSGNEVTASREVLVSDTTPPALTVPADVTLECPAATGPDSSGWASAAEVCSTATVAHSDQVTPGCGMTESVQRTWTATDAHGNASSLVQTIRVVDTTPPVITSSARLRGDRDDDEDWRIRCEFSATDTCGKVSSLTAVLVTPCREIRGVRNGQSVRVRPQDFRCRESGLDRSDPWVARLIVTAVDECGNASTSETPVLVKEPRQSRKDKKDSKGGKVASAKK